MIICLGTTPTVQRTMSFERVTLDAVNRAADVVESASGKSINVARVLNTLGPPYQQEVIATGFLGGDSGQFIREDLNRAGIGHDFVTVAPKTRTCTTVIDRSAGTASELIQESSAVEEAAWEWLRARLGELLGRAKVLVLSGSLPPGGEQGFYAGCVGLASAAGVKTIVDASEEPLRRALSARPTVVKPNRAEVAKTLDVSVDSDVALREAIKRLVAQGPTWAVITLGAEGSVVCNGQQFWRVRLTAPVKVVSTIGSGDALAAGLAAALARGETMPEACRLATACAAANCMTPVAGFVRIEDIRSLLDEVQIESW